MRHERQLELLRRIEAASVSLNSEPWPLAGATMRQPASTYADPDHFAKEMRMLFRGGPVMLGLSCELNAAGSYLTAGLGGVPVLVVRQSDGGLKGFINACRHRGAPIAEDRGCAKGSFTCPYHAWNFGLDGALRMRPWAETAFDDAPKEDLGLHPVSVAEGYGFIFAQIEGGASLTAEAALQGAEADLADYKLENYHHFETRTAEWNLNWKLVLDTFLESYHIRSLHRQSIWPHYLSNASLFDAFGPHSRFIGLLRSVLDEFKKEREEDRVLTPHGTAQYILVPGGLITYQRDHIELWCVTPIAVNRTRVATSIFTAEAPQTDSAKSYWRKNLDLLLEVTGREDFPLMEKIQKNLASGALPELVYGRNEPALIHFHQSINAALADARIAPR
jgi:phenylpropionate dioxygenase-like ring-hydroxylating dioxygenase large terminal subunit